MLVSFEELGDRRGINGVGLQRPEPSERGGKRNEAAKVRAQTPRSTGPSATRQRRKVRAANSPARGRIAIVAHSVNRSRVRDVERSAQEQLGDGSGAAGAEQG